MSKLFEDLAALDKKIADRWKSEQRDNDKGVLSAADVDFILADVIKSAHTADITEKQGSAFAHLLNGSVFNAKRTRSSRIWKSLTSVFQFEMRLIIDSL